MPFNVLCPNCKVELISDDPERNLVRCPQCENQFVLEAEYAPAKAASVDTVTKVGRAILYTFATAAILAAIFFVGCLLSLPRGHW
jgi:hypothetical protein